MYPTSYNSVGYSLRAVMWHVEVPLFMLGPPKAENIKMVPALSLSSI